jgi:hypothetical protein
MRAPRLVCGGLVVAGLLAGIAARSAPAQDFSVTTRLFDVSSREPQLLGNSSTLFHAGKVYDHLDRIGEMIVFDPAQQRFILASNTKMIRTTLRFAEIENSIYHGEQTAAKRVQQLKLENDPKRRGALGPIEFQLHPAFQQQYDPAARRLKLSSSEFSYQISCDDKIDAPLVDAYLRYADWMARLNYVLQAQMLPAPRIAVNTILHERGLLPYRVELHSGQPSTKNQMHLRAEHRFEWKLSTKDRETIYYWEELLQDPNLKHVTPQQFQTALMSEQKTARR